MPTIFFLTKEFSMNEKVLVIDAPDWNKERLLALGIQKVMTQQRGEIPAEANLMSDVITPVLNKLRSEIATDDMTPEEQHELNELDEVIKGTGEVFSLIGQMREEGGPATFMGLVRYYMTKYKLGVKRVAVATKIDPRRMKILMEDLDGPVPGEMAALSNFFLPKIQAEQARDKAKPSFLEQKRAQKQQRLAEKEARKSPRLVEGEFL